MRHPSSPGGCSERWCVTSTTLTTSSFPPPPSSASVASAWIGTRGMEALCEIEIRHAMIVQY